MNGYILRIVVVASICVISWNCSIQRNEEKTMDPKVITITKVKALELARQTLQKENFTPDEYTYDVKFNDEFDSWFFIFSPKSKIDLSPGGDLIVLINAYTAEVKFLVGD